MAKRADDVAMPFAGASPSMQQQLAQVFGRPQPSQPLPYRGAIPSSEQALAYALAIQRALGNPAFMTMEAARVGNPMAQDILQQFVGPEYMSQDALAAIQRYAEGRQKAGNIGAIPAAVAGVGYDLLKFLDPSGSIGRTLGISDISFGEATSKPSRAALTNYLAGIGSTFLPK